MYCSRCGTEAISETKYCRLCGLNLLPVTLLLKGQNLLTPLPGQGNDKIDIINNRLIQIGFIVLFIGLFGTIIFGVLDIDKLAGLFSAVLIAGAGLMAYPWVPGLLSKESRKLNASTSLPPVTVTKDRKFTTGQIKAIPPSVTEHTTHKLEDPRQQDKVAVKKQTEI